VTEVTTEEAITFNRRFDNIERDMAVMINYMRAIGDMLGARKRLQALDDELEQIQRRRTDPAPPMEDA
jgi:ABC-type uncharacterized transport system fused permease/ATPase subunit